MGNDPVEQVRAICLGLPEVEEKPFGDHTAPAFRVRNKMFVTTSEDGTYMSMKVRPGVQQTLVGDDPELFFVPPYVGAKGWVGVRLRHEPGGAAVEHDWDELRGLIEESFRMIAPKRLAVLLDPDA
jgi:hypothetical protein